MVGGRSDKYPEKGVQWYLVWIQHALLACINPCQRLVLHWAWGMIDNNEGSLGLPCIWVVSSIKASIFVGRQ